MKFNERYVPIEGEIWKQIEGFEGLYSVSNLGRVRAEEPVSLANLHVRKPVKFIKSIFKTQTGYCFVCLHNSGDVIQRYVHRLVAGHFIEKADDKKYVNHRNGIKDDNRAVNLEWVTFSENMNHGFEIGLYNQLGQKNNNSVLTEGKAILIKTLCINHSTDEILEIMGIPKDKRHLVANIKCGRLWKHLKV